MSRCDSLTHDSELSCELTIIECLQLHRHAVGAPGDLAWQTEEREEAYPGCVGIRWGKPALPHPHAQICQRQLQSGHGTGLCRSATRTSGVLSLPVPPKPLRCH